MEKRYCMNITPNIGHHKMIKTVLAATLLSTLLTGCWDSGNGEKVGIITKVAKQGAMCPTWEAEIQRGGMSNGSGVNGQTFAFTIEGNDALVAQLVDDMEHQREVKITYRTEFATYCRSDSDHNAFITSLTSNDVSSTRPLNVAPVSVQPVKPTPPGDHMQQIVELLNNQAKINEALVKELANKQQ
jgi:hypothetical protein